MFSNVFCFPRYRLLKINLSWFPCLQIAVPEGSDKVKLNEAISPDSVDPDNVESISVVVESAETDDPSITSIVGSICCLKGIFQATVSLMLETFQ